MYPKQLLHTKQTKLTINDAKLLRHQIPHGIRQWVKISISLFSVRQGIKQSKAIQLESMDDDLRNGLWNVLGHHFPPDEFDGASYLLHEMYKNIWTDFLKKPVDEYIPYSRKISHVSIKNIFLLGSWDEVFDLIEFVIRCLSVHGKISLEKPFIEQCNIVLEEENSAYKIVGRLVTPITSQEEIKSIEAAMVTRYASANEHIRKALYYLSRRKITLIMQTASRNPSVLWNPSQKKLLARKNHLRP